MDYGYIVKFSNQNLYKEIQIMQDDTHLLVGMDLDCNVRLYKEDYFEKFQIAFYKGTLGWQIACSENIYIDQGDVRKIVTKELQHGDSFYVRYRASDKPIFKIDFMIDFENEVKRFDRIIDISQISTIYIGNDKNHHIILNSKYTQNDEFVLKKTKEGLLLSVIKTTYGVYHDGKQVHKDENISVGDFISVADYSFYYKDGCLYTDSNSDLGIKGLPYEDFSRQITYPKFTRNTRIRTVVNDEEIEILDPPAKPKPPKNNLLSRILPSILMIGASVIMGLMMGRSMIAFSIISGAMGIVTGIIGLLDGKKEFRENSEERIVKYNHYIEEKRKEIETCREEEAKALDEIYLSPQEEQHLIMDFSPALFDRTREDEDFLAVRLGSGAIEAKREIKFKKQEKLEIEDDLQLLPEQLHDEYQYVENAPVVCNFKEINAVSIVGESSNRFDLLKNIVIDLCSRHYYSDIQMFFVAEPKNRDKVHWLRLLPFAYNQDLDIRNIVIDNDSKNIIFEYLYKELTRREETKAFAKHFIVFFYDEYGIKNHPLSKFIEKGKELGATFVFFNDVRTSAPQGCDFIVELQSEDHGIFMNAQDKNDVKAFRYERLKEKELEAMVSMLAPVYTEEVSLESTLTKSISMFEMLDIIATEDIDLQQRWAASKVYNSMSAPLGISKNGIVNLDLHDKAHGPHGLVAGTTGSGKSEILQTYILSMATLFHPYEVGFVIIDFKGGGMANQFKDLPHLLGAITNIDGKEINRSLKSIKAELQKRQQLFAEAEVNHIDKYIKKYKQGGVAVPLPHLIVIVDEFAELKAEQPEFMKELISAARIGRSLGVHLILATQKPSGQVDDQIWSNSRFKLCLKVQSQEDSNEVLKSPLAAEIKEPGRAYLQVGNNEIFELFQSAYSGAPERVDSSKVKEFSIYQLTESGKRMPVYVQKKEKNSNENQTQLDAVVQYVKQYCSDKHIKRLPNICLPSLEKNIDFPSKANLQDADWGTVVDLGIYDDPDCQYQGPYTVDLSSQNSMIIGSAQTGKTNILQNMIRSLAVKYTPEEVNIYIIDFASMVLKNYEGLRHVGGVVTSSEDEKLKNLIKLLYTEIKVRKEKLMALGVSSFAAYREAGKTDLPQIVLIIDNLTALKELYFEDDDELLGLCREGLTVGISVVIANTQTTGIGYKYLSNFSNRIALFCNDSGEYSSLFDHCRERLDDIPGRCIVEKDKEHLECQAYLAFEGEKEIERVDEIKRFITVINSRNAGMEAKRIPVIPELLTADFVRKNLSYAMKERFSLVAGLDYASVTPFTLQLNALGSPLVVTGKEKSGKHNFMKHIVKSMEYSYPGMTEVYIFDGIKKKLAELREETNVCCYEAFQENVEQILQNIDMQLSERYDKMLMGSDDVLDTSKLIILLINNNDTLKAIGSNPITYMTYEKIIGRYKNLNICVVIGDFENTNISYSAPEIIRNLRDNRHFMYFDDIENMKILDLPLSLMRQYKKAINTGDGYYIKETTVRKVKTVRG